ncbi:ribosome small subunit-dependent GTPase A [uncultured Rothia sp.]|uniref:ribosome small subunit-dependent GTPase A n=1 Tax=uncultured Rothia sp. TaxID=316088 RepID=UPI003216AF55
MKNNLKTTELLRTLGLAEQRESPFNVEKIAPNEAIGRVVVHHGNHAEVALISPENLAFETVRLSPHLADTPVSGDWIIARKGVLEKIAPRYTELSRPAASGVGSQAMAVNIDTVLLVISIEKPPSLKAIEKLLIMGWDSGATPVLVLSKTDLCTNVQEELERVEALSMGVKTICCSTEAGEGLAEISSLVSSGTTTMLGASGAGKTSLLNALEGTQAATSSVRRDGQGRHTTTTRKLYLLRGGGVILDVPGIRSLTVGASTNAVDETFSDIVELAQECRYADCKHRGDLGCAVQAAVDDGALPARRLESWHTVQRELAYQRRKNSPRAMAEQKKAWKQLTKSSRQRS